MAVRKRYRRSPRAVAAGCAEEAPCAGTQLDLTNVATIHHGQQTSSRGRRLGTGLDGQISARFSCWSAWSHHRAARSPRARRRRPVDSDIAPTWLSTMWGCCRPACATIKYSCSQRDARPPCPHLLPPCHSLVEQSFTKHCQAALSLCQFSCSMIDVRHGFASYALCKVCGELVELLFGLYLVNLLSRIVGV